MPKNHCKQVLLTLLLCTSVSLDAFADAANSFVLERTVYFANDQVVIDLGVLTRDSTDLLLTTSNIWVIRNETVLRVGDQLAPLDPTRVPNVIQAFSGGGFLAEPIGFTQPVGTIEAGTWAIVEDRDQDGIFDAGDSVLYNAFTVDLSTDVPEVMTQVEILQLKLRATAMRDEYTQARRMFEFSISYFRYLTWAARGVAAIGGGFRAGASAVASAVASEVRDQIKNLLVDSSLSWGKDVVKDTLNDSSAHYAGIAADPPDPYYQALTALAPRRELYAASADPFDIGLTQVVIAVQEEAAVAEAFLKSLERYQGAQLDGNGSWGLVHARQVRDYANLLAGRAESSRQALQDLADTLDQDTADFDGLAIQYQDIADDIALNGFPPDVQAQIANWGLSPAEMAELRERFAAVDLEGLTKAAFIARLQALRSALADLAASLPAVVALMETAITQLESDPLVNDDFPTADAGGPYVSDLGDLVAFDASGSQAGVGTIVSFAWDLDSDGAFDDGIGSAPSTAFSLPAERLVGLEVRNSNDRRALAYASLTVQDPLGAPSIDSFDSEFVNPLITVGDTRSFSVNVTGVTGTPDIVWYLDGVWVANGSSFDYVPGLADIGVHMLQVVITDPSGRMITQEWNPEVQEADGDGDGYAPSGGDCDDANVNVNPAAVEVIDNGIDDDCDPLTEDADQPPLADFFSDPFLGASGEPVTLTDASSDPNGDIVDYLWDFGDGSPLSSQRNPQHSFARALTYTVTLTVTDSQGNADTKTLAVEVLGERKTTLVSRPDIDLRDVLGELANHHSSTGVSISADGRWVAFTSMASNLVADDSNQSRDVFVADTHTGKIVRVSVHTDGTEVPYLKLWAAQMSGMPIISPDGRFVIFRSVSSRLIGADLDGDGQCDPTPQLEPGECSGHTDGVYIRDRDTDGNGVFDEPGGVATLLASRYYRQASNQLNSSYRGLSMSDDARFVAWESYGRDHVPGVIGAQGNIAAERVYVADLLTNEVRNVTRDLGGVPVFGHIARSGRDGRTMSADGRYLVWYTSAGDDGRFGGTGGVAGEDTDGDGVCDQGCKTPGFFREVYVYDWVTDTNRQLSINSLGEPATYTGIPNSFRGGSGSGSLFPSISANGRWVAFTSQANNLYLDDQGQPLPMLEAGSRQQDIYVHDRDTDEDGVFDEPGDISTELVSLTLDGLANGQTGGGINEFVLITQSGSGQHAKISDNGRFVQFVGVVNAFVEGFVDPIGTVVRSTLVLDRLTSRLTTPFVRLDGIPVTGTGTGLDYMFHDGRYSLLETNSDRLTGIDTTGNGRCNIDCDNNGLQDVYLTDRDPDGDGLFDVDDACLNTAPGAAVDADGCALPAALAISAVSVDASIPQGFDATFDVTVTNSGQARLLDVRVADALVDDCAVSLGDLAAGESTRYTCTAFAVTTAFSHLLVASASTQAGETVQAEGSAAVTLFTAGIAVQHGPDPATVAQNSNFIMNVSVTNSGDIDLSDIAVSSDPIPGCARTIGALGAGLTASYSCLGEIGVDEFVSRVDVSGQPPLGTAVSDFDTATVLVSAPTDTSPPVIALPADSLVEADGPLGTAFTYDVTVTDDSDPNPLLRCSPASGSIFSLVTTTVECNATDASGNQSSATFTLTVVDTTPPTIRVPADIEVTAPDDNGAVVDFATSATDTVDGIVATMCAPSSGALFPIGETLVTCQSTDIAGNPGTAAFAVNVTAPTAQPVAPANLYARVKSSKVQLVWSHTGAEAYDVYRSTTGGGGYILIGSTPSTYSTYLDTIDPGGVTYYYVVRARIGAVQSSDSNEVSAIARSRQRR